jgi:hypothetical protein
MSSLPNYADTLSPVQGYEPLLIDITDLADDESLLAELWAKNQENNGYFSKETGLRFANSELAHLARELYSAEQLSTLEAFLAEKGTLNIPIETGQVTVDGTKYDVSFVAATEVDPNSPNHGDMSSMLYLRDHVQAASVLIDLHLQDPERYHEEGKIGHELLMSGLLLMSTPAQLARFNDVIERGNEAGQEDWPHISLHFNDLEATEPNGWRNKQDTFQMLAYLTLDAIS